MQISFLLPSILFLLAFGCLNFSDALKCFTCDGICDCRDNQVPETCAPDAFCFTVKAATSGQIIRKGCTRECRTVSNQNWQKCHLCDDENLCNDQEYRAGLFDDCAVEEFIGLGFGLPAKRRRPQPPNQQYRRSLYRYGESQGPAQNAGGGGYAQSPSQTDFYGASGPQQNQMSAAQQQSAGPNQNSFLVNSPSVNAAADSSISSQEEVSSPGMTERGGGQPAPASARINAFLDRMSPRSVPVGFFGQQNTDSQQQWPQSRSAQFNNNPQSGPRQNSFGNGGSPQQNSGAPSMQFGGVGLSPSQTQAGPDGNGAVPPPSLVNLMMALAALVAAMMAAF